jgi:hypothetical protein
MPQSIIVREVVLGDPVVSVLAIGPKVRGFKPERGRWIFKGDKNLQHAFLWRGSKAVGPMLQDFTACETFIASIKEILRKAKFIISFTSFSCFGIR